MKKFLGMFTVMFLIFWMSPGANATTYTFQPSPANLYNLEHGYYYVWGIDWTLPSSSVITRATLTIKNIDDWAYPDSGNVLYVNLLESAPKGVGYRWDGGGSGDYFTTHWTSNDLLGSWSDNNPVGVTNNISFPILSPYYGWLASGNFGFGFDPDCHFYNDGITLTIITAPDSVPEPSVLILLALGLAGLAASRMKFQTA